MPATVSALTELLVDADPDVELAEVISAAASDGEVRLFLVSGELLAVREVLAAGKGWILIHAGFGESESTSIVPLASIARVSL